MGPAIIIITLRASLMKNNKRITEYTPYRRHRDRKYRLLIWGATNDTPAIERKQIWLSLLNHPGIRRCFVSTNKLYTGAFYRWLPLVICASLKSCNFLLIWHLLQLWYSYCLHVQVLLLTDNTNRPTLLLTGLHGYRPLPLNCGDYIYVRTVQYFSNRT